MYFNKQNVLHECFLIHRPQVCLYRMNFTWRFFTVLAKQPAQTVCGSEYLHQWIPCINRQVVHYHILEVLENLRVRALGHHGRSSLSSIGWSRLIRNRWQIEGTRSRACSVVWRAVAATGRDVRNYFWNASLMSNFCSAFESADRIGPTVCFAITKLSCVLVVIAANWKMRVVITNE